MADRNPYTSTEVVVGSCPACGTTINAEVTAEVTIDPSTIEGMDKDSKSKKVDAVLKIVGALVRGHSCVPGTVRQAVQQQRVEERRAATRAAQSPGDETGDTKTR